VVDRVHLIAPAGVCGPFLTKLECDTPEALVAMVQRAIGPTFTVTADVELLAAMEDESRGGRTDDTGRAADIQAVLADDEVVALLAIRGGAWLTRILPHIDFSVLGARRRRVAVWGFSELTTLVNIVGHHPNGLGVYDMGPAFLAYGLRHYAQMARLEGTPLADDDAAWARERLRPEFDAFHRNLGAMLHGDGEAVEISARIERGAVPSGCSTASFVGGNLTVLSTLVGTPFEPAIDPDGKWLLLEDYNDKPERLDRFLSHLSLAGYFRRSAGVLLGDFHFGERDLLPTILAILDYHLPAGRSLPVLSTRQIGHTWPMTPLPVHTPAEVIVTDEDRVRFVFSPHVFAMIDVE